MKLTINENLYLKLVKLSDASDIFNTIDHQREYLGEWLPFVQYIKEVADEEDFLKSVLETMEQTQEYIFCIRKDEKFVGLISFIKPDIANQKTEIGYWISKDYQKQGIVTQATKRLCEFAFKDLGVNRVQLRCAVGNLPSKSIPERLGFTFEGIERHGERVSEGIFRDLEVCSILKSEFLCIMDTIIRPINPSEYPLMEDFLYEAIFIPEGIETPPRDIVKHPDLQIYISDFGKQRGDVCWVAEVESKIVGMAWSRIMKDYGYLDDETPSLSVSLLPEYRQKGIGTVLFKSLLENLKTEGYKRVSLSVQKANYASQWYLQLGFRIVTENETDYVMDYWL